MDDQNKTFRTRLVAMWMLTNGLLAVTIENIEGLPTGNEQQDEAQLQSKQQFYFSVILYSTFALSLVRFIGVSMVFLLNWASLTLFTPSSACSTGSSATCSGCAGGRER